MTVTISKPAVNIREKLAEVDKPSGTAGQALLRAETVAEQQHLLGVGRRNIVINGDFSQWQRGTSFTSMGTDGTYLADRWVYSEGSITTAFTVTKEAGPKEKGFANAIKFNVTTADNSLAAGAFVQLLQKIEGYNLQTLAKGTDHAKSVTVSFYVKSNKPGRYGLTLWDSPNNRQNSGSYEIETPDTWEYKTVTFTGDTTGTIDNDNTEGLQLSFTLAMGTSYTGGDEGVSAHSGNADNYSPFHEVNLIESTGNTWELAGVQMEVGTVATPFEHRSYGEQRAECQRYYYKINSAENNANYHRFAMVNVETSTEAEAIFIHPVTMRASPTLEATAASGFHIFSANFIRTVTGMSIDQSSPYSVGLALTASGGGLTGGNVGILDANNNKTAQIAFSAEL